MDFNIFLHIWKREWMPSASKLFAYLFYMWRKCDVTVTFMTLLSCNSVCCMCGEAWSSRWLMTQLTNGQHACVLVFVPVVDILNIPCDCQFVLVALWNRADHYIFILWFLLLSSFFFPRLISAVADWMSAILLTWCGLSANLGCRSKTCCTQLAENTGRKKVAKNRHLNSH